MYANIAGILVVNPINVHFLWKRNVLSKYSTYMKPVLIGSACYIFWALVLPSHWIFRAGILVLYVVLCFVFEVLTFNDLELLFEQIARLLKNQVFRQVADSNIAEVSE